MTSQTFNFNGAGPQTTASIAVNAGERVRLRLSQQSGYPILSLSITQNSTTDIVPLGTTSGTVVELPACAPGDSIAVIYEGQTAGDTAVGILESISTPLAIVGGGSGGGASLSDQSVVDANGVFWLARDNGSSVTYTNWATGAVGTPASPVAPAGKLTGEQVNSVSYSAATAGPGYAVGDVLVHDVIYNIATSPASIVAAAWLNLSQATILTTAPTIANLAFIGGNGSVSLSAPLPAGSNFIGAVADAKVIQATPVVTANSAYAAGQCIGGLLTFANAGRAANGNGTLQDALVMFADSQTQPLDLVLFSASPSSSGLADKTTYSLAAADVAKVLRVIHLSDFTSHGTPSSSEIHGLVTKYVADGSGDIYGILVARGTPIFGTTGDVTVQIGVERNA